MSIKELAKKFINVVKDVVTGFLYIIRIRKLTPTECFRLMDMPEWAIERIQMAGLSEGFLDRMEKNFGLTRQEIRKIRNAGNNKTTKENLLKLGLSQEDVKVIINQPIPKSQQYKLAGNSIVVACMWKMFDRLIDERPKDEVEPGTQLMLF